MIAADVALALGYFWWDDDIDRYDYDTGEVWGAARINIPFGGGGLNEELEVSGLAGFEDDSYYSYGAFSHTYWKNPGRGRRPAARRVEHRRERRAHRRRRGCSVHAVGNAGGPPRLYLGRRRPAGLLDGERRGALVLERQHQADWHRHLQRLQQRVDAIGGRRTPHCRHHGQPVRRRDTTTPTTPATAGSCSPAGGCSSTSPARRSRVTTTRCRSRRPAPSRSSCGSSLSPWVVRCCRPR